PSAALPGSLAEVTLPVSNAETHFDARLGDTYAYRTDTMGGYVTDNNQPVLNGILTQRTQQDDTGVSDVTSLTTQYAPSMATAAGGQSVLALNSTLTGQAQGGGSASRNRGGTQVSSMGYLIQSTDGLGRASNRTYDAYGRVTSATFLPGTAYQQTTTTAYDDALGYQPQSINGQPVPPTRYSVRTTDPHGNLAIKTYDVNQRQTGAFEQRVGNSLVQTEGYLYMSNSDDRLTAAVLYGNGWQKQENYYYAHGSSQRVATVPNVGLAEGSLVDGINGNTLSFKYAPGASPLTIGTIYGPVKITHADRISHLVLSEGLIDAAAATKVLNNIDLANVPSGSGMTAPGDNPWIASGNLAPNYLIPLYQAIGTVPGGNASTPGNLLEYTTYGYDEWNRKVSTRHYAFYNSGNANAPTPALSQTTTALAYNTAQRAVTTTYPQGQQETRSYNLLNGLQSASLQVNGATTSLGGIVHDGLGRVVQYNDTLNGGHSTASYAPGSGLLSAAADAYGNALTLNYDSTTGLLTNTSLTPANGGSPITVDYSYDSHLQPTQVADNQGATYSHGYGPDGLPTTSTTQYAGQNPNGLGFIHDAYGDLAGATDSFLPPVQGLGFCQQNMQSPAYYQINRDSYGRLANLALVPVGNGGYFGVTRSRGYDPVTGLVSTETTSSLPSTLLCYADTSGALGLTTAFGYDQNLRPILKTVTRSDVAGQVPPLPAGVADLALTVTAPVKARTYKEMSYVLTVRNKTPRLGNQPATGVTLSFAPAGGAAEHLVYTKIPKGCALAGGKVTCALPDLAGGQRARITLKVKPTTAGSLAPRIRARSAALDPRRTNHALIAATKVCATGACGPGRGIRYLVDGGAGGGPVAQAVFGLTYDTANHVAQSSRQDLAGTSLTENYTYDVQTGALVGYGNDNGGAAPYARWTDTVPVTNAVFTYDLYGNLTQKTYSNSEWGMSASVNLAAGSGDNPFQVSAVTETGVNQGAVQGAYQYDIAGNVTSDPYGRGYTYDAHGLLASISRGEGGVETFVRDGRGRLMQRQAAWLIGPVYEYGHARSSNNQWQVEFTGGATYFPDGPFQQPTRPSTLPVTDLQGRPVNTLSYGANQTGFTVLANTSSLPDGIATNLLAPTAGYPAGIADTTHYPQGAMGTALGIDVGTGLQLKAGYRAYDPVVGRFMQWDSLSPFGRGGLHGYAYAGNDPVNFDDPTGHYAEAKTHRYGPKPPHAHHDGFWQGFGAGLKTGAESIYTQPYHWGKTMVHDLAKGNVAGLVKSAFNAAVSATANMYAGSLGGMAGQLVFQEFVSADASAVFSGKSPVQTHNPFKGNAYQIGYQLGDQSAAGAEMATLTLITMGVGAAVEAATVDIEALSVDADVATDSAQSSDSMLTSERIDAEAGRISNIAAGDGSAAEQAEPVKMEYGDLQRIRSGIRRQLITDATDDDEIDQSRPGLKRYRINQMKRFKINSFMNDRFADFSAETGDLSGASKLDWATALETTPKSVYMLKPLEIASHIGIEVAKSNLREQPGEEAPNPDAVSGAAKGPSKPVPYQ
ncbi:MAG: RHS repeat-associated core domain-containing protein, partial [Methylococcus sp.]